MVAAPPSLTPLDRTGRKSFIQYLTESLAAMLLCDASLGSCQMSITDPDRVQRKIHAAYIEEEGILDCLWPARLVVVPIADLVRSPEHRHILETEGVAISLQISLEIPGPIQSPIQAHNSPWGPGVVPRSLGSDIISDVVRLAVSGPIAVRPSMTELAADIGPSAPSTAGAGARVRRALL